jgi:hypothetical protein
MTSVEDFTGMRSGEEVALEGRVGRCGRCGRTGIEHAIGDGSPAYVIHVQITRVLGDGMLTEPSDYCVIDDAPGGGPGPGVGVPSRRGCVALARRPAQA